LNTTVVTQKSQKKWINASVAISCIFVGYAVFRLLNFLRDQFELEASISQVGPMIQGVGLLAGIASFVYIMKSKKTSKYLDEAFTEFSKVVFPDKNETVGMTFRVIILVTIVGIFLGFIDVLTKIILEQVL